MCDERITRVKAARRPEREVAMAVTGILDEQT
jgi:hypothetical protein